MHDLSPFLDLLHAVGSASLNGIWLPALVWTSTALIAVAALRLAPALPPLWTYRFRQALLAALPVGILAAALIDLPAQPLPNSSFSTSTLATATLPEAVATPGFVSLTWMHALGLFTVAAACTAGFALSKLCLRIVRTRLMTASVRQRYHDAGHESQPASLVQRTDALRSRLGVRRSVEPVFAEEADSPMLLPGRPAVIALPTWMLEPATIDADVPTALDMSIAHELLHLKRYDDWAGFAEQLVASLAAIHPLVHLLIHDIQLNRETACDAAVLSALHCRRGSYARLLAKVATRQHTVPVVALSESTSSLEERLRAMTFSDSNTSDPNASSVFLQVLSVGVFALMIVGMVACTDSPSGTESSKSTATADTDEANTQPTEVVTPEEMKSDAFEHPSLVGGMKALSEAVSYPETAAEQGVQGRVFVQFTVMKDASLRDVQVVRGVSPELDAEAIRAVKETSFEPGTMDGEPVPVRMTLPITFQLSNEG